MTNPTWPFAQWRQVLGPAFAIALMTAAMPVVAGTSGDGVRTRAEVQKLTADCKAKGGTISTAGLAGAPHCVLRTSDAGKPCTSSSQCEAGCIATDRRRTNEPATGRCKETTEPFGCYARVEGGVVGPVLCVD